MSSVRIEFEANGNTRVLWITGMHSSKAAPVHHVNDISGDVKAAKGMLPSLERGRHRAVVEHVFNGARVKVMLKREPIMLTIALSGARGALLLRGSVVLQPFTRTASSRDNSVCECDMPTSLV